jgi:hypothetical protein
MKKTVAEGSFLLGDPTIKNIFGFATRKKINYSVRLVQRDKKWVYQGTDVKFQLVKRSIFGGVKVLAEKEHFYGKIAGNLHHIEECDDCLKIHLTSDGKNISRTLTINFPENI